MTTNKHRGSTLDSFLEEEGLFQDTGKRFSEEWRELETAGVVAVTKLTARGGVTIPKAMRDKHGWSAGTKLKLSQENGNVLLVKVRKQDD